MVTLLKTGAVTHRFSAQFSKILKSFIVKKTSEWLFS